MSFGIETFGFIKSIVERYLYNDGAPDIEVSRTYIINNKIQLVKFYKFVSY